MSINFTEVFTSLQGEGIYVGAPSVFLRLFGCNFTCSGFSNKENAPLPKVDLSDIIDVRQLDGNQFTVGCDSRYSWDKDFRKLVKKDTAKGVVDLVLSSIGDIRVRHLVITGGEPTLNQNALIELFEELTSRSTSDPAFPIKIITIETNASIYYKTEFLKSIQLLTYCGFRLLFSNSPKLSMSGEPLNKRVNFEVIRQQSELITESAPSTIISTFKFVVGNEEDAREAKQIHNEFRGVFDIYDRGWTDVTEYNFLNLMFMPLGATVEQYRANLKTVAELAIKYGASLTPRMHLDIWGNAVGT